MRDGRHNAHIAFLVALTVCVHSLAGCAKSERDTSRNPEAVQTSSAPAEGHSDELVGSREQEKLGSLASAPPEAESLNQAAQENSRSEWAQADESISRMVRPNYTSSYAQPQAAPQSAQAAPQSAQAAPLSAQAAPFSAQAASPSLRAEPEVSSDAMESEAYPAEDVKAETGQMSHSPAVDSIQPDTASPTSQIEPPALLLGNQVDIYFATDRLPTSELLPTPIRTFAPAAVVAMLCAAFFIGLSAARRFQAIWLVSCGMAVCMTIMVLHGSIIRWQQFSRLSSNATTRFSTLRFESQTEYPLHVGTAKVSLPTLHEPGKVESPSLFRLEFTEDPSKHIVLHSLDVSNSSDDWFESLSEEMDRDVRRDGFIFIHGYNVKFGDALKRTAQLSKDLHITGPSICYSWPSRGQVASYTADEASVSWSAPHFERLVLDLRNRANCRHINIVAHSMGNRALLEAIERLYIRDSKGNEKLVDALVLAAPDVDTAQFTTRFIEPLRAVAARTTLYFSDGDRALMLSQRIHQAPRLGLSGDSLPSIDGIEAIHIGAQPLFGLGHSYYGSDVAVIDDMRAMLNEGKFASDRLFLRSAKNSTGADYWELDRALHARASTTYR